MARVFLTRSAHNARAALDSLRADAVLNALDALGRNPRVGHDLRGQLTGLRSYRVGVYRIVYELCDDTTVRVVAIRYRGSAYGAAPR